jgi:PAS domain-containing protein
MDAALTSLPAALAALAGGVLAGAGLRWLWPRALAGRPVLRPAPLPLLPAGAAAAPAEPAMVSGDAIARRIARSPTPFWRYNLELKLAAVNATYARVLGVDTTEDAVRSDREIFAGQRAHAAEVRASRRFGVAETTMAADTRNRAFDIVHLPLDDGEVLGFALDRSDREHSRSQTRLRGQLAERAIAALPLGVALFDASRALLAHNRAFAELFQLDSAMLDTRPDFDRLLDAMRTAGRLPESPNFPSWREARRAWFAATGRPVEEDWSLPTGEVLRVRADATPDGCLVLVIEDLTERVLLAGTRQSLLAVHQATLDHLTDGVAVFGPDGQIKLFNRRFTEIVLMDPAELMANPTADALIEHVARLLREPARAQGLRDLIMSATGGRAGRSGRLASVLGFVLDYRSVPLPDGNALFTLTDVTPRSPDAGG